MKHLLVVFLLLTAASICYATSNITFAGGGYEISVLLSDEDCKVVGLNVSGDKSKHYFYWCQRAYGIQFDCKKKTIHIVVPATKSHPYFELKSTSKNGHLILKEKKVKVSPDWQM